MVLISHRGNIAGPNPKRENSPAYIDKALNAKYFVEVDVWYEKGWWLGHDKPQYKMPKAYFGSVHPYFFFHAKNPIALEKMTQMDCPYNSFWHQEDAYTITRWGLVWVYPGRKLLKRSICVLPERGYEGNLRKCYGICSDYIERYK